jgi:hypothetical protein
MIVAIPIILWRLLFLKAIRDSTMINKMEIAIKERLTRRRLTGEINQRCKYRYSKYCRDGKEEYLLYYIDS